jgi:hypothetical protein
MKSRPGIYENQNVPIVDPSVEVLVSEISYKVTPPPCGVPEIVADAVSDALAFAANPANKIAPAAVKIAVFLHCMESSSEHIFTCRVIDDSPSPGHIPVLGEFKIC